MGIVLIVLAWTALCTLPARAQLNVGRSTAGAFHPSLNSPSSYMQNNFQQIGATLGGGWSPAQLARQANTPTQLSAGPRYPGQARGRSPYGGERLGGNGYQPSRTQLRVPVRQSSSLLGSAWVNNLRPGTLLSQVEATTFYGYSPIGYRGRELFDHDSTKFASWGMPELVAKRPLADTAISGPGTSDQPGAAPATLPAEESIPAARISMGELMKNQLGARSEFHETRAREAFRADHYQEACSQFAIAEAAAVRDPARQAYLKLGQVYASMAAQQYAEAVNHLRALLQADPQGERLVDPAVFNRFRDVASLYGDPATYAQQCRILDQIGAAQALDVGVLALRALAAWGRNDVNTALPFAKKVAETLQPPVQSLEQQAKAEHDKALQARQQVDQARAAAAAAQDPDEVKKQREAARAQEDAAFTAEATEAKVQTQKRRLAALTMLHPLLAEAVRASDAANRGIEPEPVGSALPLGGPSPPVSR